MLRNTVLQIMGDTIVNELSTEELPDESKEIRDEFLEDLHNHILDISAHVRSKCLQIWSHLRNVHSVPLAWQHRVLKAAAGRLEDKATLVRKNAVLLIRAFTETNPFAAKLSLAELTDKYKVEAQRLQDIRERMLAVEKRNEEMQEKWLEMADEVMRVIADELERLPTVVGRVDGSAGTAEDVEAAGRLAAEQILQLLLEKQLDKAVQLLRRVDTVNAEELEAMPVEQRVQYYAVLLRSYMFLGEDLVS